MANDNPFEWQEILTGEMLLLGLLGRIIYHYPENQERSWLKSLIDEEIFLESPFGNDNAEIQSGLQLLQKWAGTGLSDEEFLNMQADYTRLFIGFEKVAAPPWESVYFGDDYLIFQQRMLDVRSVYQRFGLEAEKIHQEPDDHIGLELAFMSHLAALGIQALCDQDMARWDELLEGQREFLAIHLGAWAFAWCARVEENAKTDIYQGVALLTRGALSVLAEVLDIKLVEEPVR
ncbi:MAG: molecular chaperone TorD family protein [Chloroflexi bacterium]|nr:molecular chaperone TorD family protein [Chloroflexota bacterium]